MKASEFALAVLVLIVNAFIGLVLVALWNGTSLLEVPAQTFAWMIESMTVILRVVAFVAVLGVISLVWTWLDERKT